MSDIRGERSVVIAAPLDEVFNYVSDFSRHHEWNYQILEITKLTAGEVGVGTRFRAQEQPPDSLPTFGKLIFPVMIKIVGMSKVTEAEITRWEPEREIAWKAVSRARGDQTWMSSEWSLTLE